MTKQALKQAIIEFMQSERGVDDLWEFLRIGQRAFKQGTGLGGREISEAFAEAKLEVYAGK